MPKTKTCGSTKFIVLSIVLHLKYIQINIDTGINVQINLFFGSLKN